MLSMTLCLHETAKRKETLDASRLVHTVLILLRILKTIKTENGAEYLTGNRPGFSEELLFTPMPEARMLIA